jgi:ParB family chromosome partitioning protein
MEKSKRSALGKGLSSLLAVEPADSPKQVVETVIQEKPLELPLASIEPNPFQPRLDFRDEELKELAESIEKQGLIQPIAVREIETEKYQIVSGERRFRAFTLLKREVIPVVLLKDVDDTRMLEMALVENIQRENLNEIETALSYQRLLFECGLSHQQLSEQVGKSRSSITNSLRLLKLPQSLQNMVRDGELTMGHARALLSFAGDEKRQESVAKQIVTEGLSVRAVEKMGNPVSKAKEKPAKAPVPAHYETLTSEWKEAIGLGVAIKNGTNGAGKVEIQFSSEEELQLISSLFGALQNG